MLVQHLFYIDKYGFNNINNIQLVINGSIYLRKIGAALVMRVFLILLLLLNSACGYHMRKPIILPEEMQFMYVQGASGALRSEIKRVVKASSGKLTKSAEDAGMIVNILEEEMRRNVLSLSSTGKATEFELYYTVAFELIDANGKIVLPRQVIEVSRDYFNDQSGENILGKASEEGVIREEIYKTAVRSVVDRSRSAFKKKLVAQ